MNKASIILLMEALKDFQRITMKIQITEECSLQLCNKLVQKGRGVGLALVREGRIV